MQLALRMVQEQDVWKRDRHIDHRGWSAFPPWRGSRACGCSTASLAVELWRQICANRGGGGDGSWRWLRNIHVSGCADWQEPASPGWLVSTPRPACTPQSPPRRESTPAWWSPRRWSRLGPDLTLSQVTTWRGEDCRANRSHRWRWECPGRERAGGSRAEVGEQQHCSHLGEQLSARLARLQISVILRRPLEVRSYLIIIMSNTLAQVWTLW